MGVELAVCIYQATFCCRYSLACGDDLAFSTDGAGLIGKRANEIDLQFQSGVTHTAGKSGVDGTAHAGVEQGGGISAMYCP